MIPPLRDGDWYLPPGIHRCTLDEIHQRFVVEAPFPSERGPVFDAFRTWAGLVLAMLPKARLWINGGFVTHKTWSAPSDIDVVILVKRSELNALSDLQQVRFDELMTDTSEGIKRKAMSGLVDGFSCARGDIEKTLIWRETWSSLLDENRDVVSDVTKGFLEVMP
jgi:hypothetical protein